MNNIVTRAYLLDNISYNPETGIFMWTKAGYGRNLNKPIGSIDINGYLFLRFEGKHHMAHRVAWFYVHQEWPPEDIDHIDRCRTNNAISNLRCVSRSDNMKNAKLRIDSKTGVPGIRWNTPSRKWRVRISSNKVEYPLGCFADFFEAVCARKAAEVKYNFHPNHGR